MSKPKRTKETYDPDWKEFGRDQDTRPVVENHEWAAIFTHRKFHPGKETKVKAHILQILTAFLRLNSGFNNVKEYRQKIKTLAGEVAKVSDSAYQLEKYNSQRLIMLSRALDVDPDFPHGLLKNNRLQSFYEAGYSVLQNLNDAIKALGKEHSGQDNSDVFWLVKMLNRIVIKHSDGGKLTRSKKDDKFVSSILAIAQRESGISIGEGTKQKAIRQLK